MKLPLRILLAAPLAGALLLTSCATEGSGPGDPLGARRGAVDDATCPDPDSPAVHYVANSNLDPDNCDLIELACDDDQTAFDDACGCGCID